MKISVLLSLFKNEDPVYFDISMKSIWDDQTRKPDEIVLVEDGPLSAELYDIINKWNFLLNDKLITVKLKCNVGLAKALNIGVKYCTGDYVARMDTDDISLPDRFELQEKYLINHPTVSLLGGAMIEIDENEDEISRRMMPLNTRDIKRVFPKTNPFVHPSVFIKRSLFKEGLEYSEKCRRNQDAELWFRIIAAGYDVANISDYILKYRKGSELYVKRNKSAYSELKIFIKGVYLLYGFFTWRYIYPFLHYLFRLLPPKLCLYIYRNIIARKKY